MTALSKAVEVLRRRRLHLARLPRVERSFARIGVAGTAAAGAGVVGFGSGLLGAAETVQTATGPGLVLSHAVIVATYAGLALAAMLILDRGVRWHRIAIGIVLMVASASMIESAFRPLEASLGSGPALVAGRVLGWVAAAVGVGLLVVRDSGAARRSAVVGAAGFGALAGAYLLGVLGTAGSVPDTARAQLSDGLGTVLLPLSSWLFVFAIWQVVEALHAGVDSARFVWRRSRVGWIPAFVGVKLALLVVGLLVLGGDRFPDWEGVRSNGPFAWAYALVIAAATVTWIRSPVGPAVTRESLLRAAVIALVAWSVPFLLGYTLVGVALLWLLVVPNSIGGVVALPFLAVAGAGLARWLSGRHVPRTVWFVVGALFVGMSLLPQSSILPMGLARIETSVIDGLSRVAEWSAENALGWQVAAFAGLLVVPLLWIGRRWRGAPIAVALFGIGVWTLPRTVRAAGLGDLASPELMTLDVALTIVAAWVIGSALLRRRRLPVVTPQLAMPLLVLTVITYGAQIGGPLVGVISDVIAEARGLEAEALAFVGLLVLPAIYGLLLDSADLNEKPPGRVLQTVGMSLVVMSVALGLMAGGVLTADNRDADFLRLVMLPGMAVVAALAAAVGERSPALSPD